MRISKYTKRTVLGGAVFATLPFINQSAQAATSYYGVQGTNGDWSVASNWVTGSNASVTNGTGLVPTSADNALIAPTTAAGNETFSVTSSDVAAELFMAPGTSTATATLNITGSGVLTLASGIASQNASGAPNAGTSIINVNSGGALDTTGGTVAMGGNGSGTVNITMNVGGTGTGAVTDTSTTNGFEVGLYSAATLNVETGGTFTYTQSNGTLYIDYGNYNASSSPEPTSNGTVNLQGGTLNCNAILICRSYNSSATGLLDLTSGSISTVGAVSAGTGGTNSGASSPTGSKAILEVDGSTMSSIKFDTGGTATTNGLSISPNNVSAGETAELKIGLDASGSTLINVTGNIVMTGAILDVNTLPGFTGLGDDPSAPGSGIYLLASYTGSTPPTGFTTTSDTALSYTMATVPGYLAIQVSVPEPASLGIMALGGIGLLTRRRTQA
jgi:hypothetical protein